MLLNMNDWENLKPRVLTSRTSPPTDIYLLINAFTRGTEIKTSWAEVLTGGETTVWRHWIVTETLLVHIDVEFAAEHYDSFAESDLPQGSRVEATVRRASAHPLTGAVALSIGAVGQLSTFQGSWYPVDGLTVAFADGSKVPLPDQSRLDVRERDSSELFFADLRHALPI